MKINEKTNGKSKKVDANREEICKNIQSTQFFNALLYDRKRMQVEDIAKNRELEYNLHEV